MSLNNVKVVKKDGTKEEFNVQKVVVAVNKSAYRALIKFSQKDIDFICHFVEEKVEELGVHEIQIPEMHNIVEGALEKVNPIVAKSYRDYRNYKQDFVQMLDEVYKKSQSIMYIGDKENSNTDSALVSTKRSLIFNELNKELYKKFFLTVEELQAIREGYIYIHDMSARRDTMNCCLFDVKSVLTGGFEMGNLWYNEPKTLDTAFDVIGDIVLSAASQQYGGFTVPSVDEILEPYAKRSIQGLILGPDGDKMSKSKGNVIYADDMVDLFGVDATRYFVLHEMPFENDGVISWELMVERMNSDLANILGNLVNRTISMTNKYFGGTVTDTGVAEEVDADLKAVVENTAKAVAEKMKDLRVADAITEIFNLFKRCNKYIDETTPWVLGKDESKKDRLSTVLWNLIQGISEGARLLEPYMPSTSKKILEQLGNGHVTEKPEILFQRMDLEEILKKVEELHPKKEEKKEEAVIDLEPKEEITFEQFGAMQFQVGEIIACEAVKKSKKLLCSQVKIGSQVKQIVSGIKAYYTPEEMVGKKVMVLVNLKPAKLAGVLSEGMLLCAEDADGNLALMTPEKEMPAGAEIC